MQTRKPSAPSTTDYFGPFIVYLEEKNDEPLVLYYRTEDGTSDSELTDLRYFPYQAGEDAPVFEASDYTEVLKGGVWPEFFLDEGNYLFRSHRVIENNRINIVKKIADEICSETLSTLEVSLAKDLRYLAWLQLNRDSLKGVDCDLVFGFGLLVHTLTLPRGDYDRCILELPGSTEYCTLFTIERALKAIEIIQVKDENLEEKTGRLKDHGLSLEFARGVQNLAESHFRHSIPAMVSFFKKMKLQISYLDQRREFMGENFTVIGKELEWLKESSNAEQKAAVNKIELTLSTIIRLYPWYYSGFDRVAELKAGRLEASQLADRQSQTKEERAAANDKVSKLTELLDAEAPQIKATIADAIPHMAKVREEVVGQLTEWTELAKEIPEFMEKECVKGIRQVFLQDREKAVAAASEDDKRVLLEEREVLLEILDGLLSAAPENGEPLCMPEHEDFTDFRPAPSGLPSPVPVVEPSLRESLNRDEFVPLSDEISELSNWFENTWPGVQRDLEVRFPGAGTIQASDYENFIHKEYKPFDKWSAMQKRILAIGAVIRMCPAYSQETITSLNETVSAGVQFLEDLSSRVVADPSVELPVEAGLKEDVEAALPAPQVAHVEPQPKARVQQLMPGPVSAVGAGTMFAVEPSTLALSDKDRVRYKGELAVFINHYSSSTTYFAQRMFNSSKKTSGGGLECVAKAEVAKELKIAFEENKSADEIQEVFTALLHLHNLEQKAFFNGTNKEKQLSEPLKNLLSSQPPAPAAKYK